jgi:hypothetical protein
MFSHYVLATSDVNEPDQPGAKARRQTDLTAFNMNLALSSVRPRHGTPSGRPGAILTHAGRNEVADGRQRRTAHVNTIQFQATMYTFR